MKALVSILIIIFTISNSIINSQVNMKYNKLTPEEKRVILHKGTELPFVGKYTENKKREFTHANNVVLNFTILTINLTAIAAGPALMTKLKVLLNEFRMPMNEEQKLSAQIVVDIWDTSFLVKGLPIKIQGTV